MKLILALGNPGPQYEKTRHNAGFRAADRIAADFAFDPFKLSAKHQVLLAEGQIAGQKVLLAKPQTFMNLSGRCAASLISFYKIPPEDILVVYDEVALESGTFRLKFGGSAGGHNGIRSLIQELGTSDFARLRLGIKPLEPFAGDLADYVLGRFSGPELERLEKILDQVPAAVELWAKEGIEAAMNRFNGASQAD